MKDKYGEAEKRDKEKLLLKSDSLETLINSDLTDDLIYGMIVRLNDNKGETQLFSSSNKKTVELRKEIIMSLIEKLNKINPDHVLIDDESFKRIIDNPKDKNTRLKLSIWFMRYLSCLRDRYYSIGTLSKEDIRYFIITNLLVIMYFDINIDESDKIHKVIYSKMELYEKINKKARKIRYFDIINLKVSSLGVKPVNLQQLIRFIEKGIEILDLYGEYMDIQGYSLNDLLILSGKMTYLVNLAMIPYSLGGIRKSN